MLARGSRLCVQNLDAIARVKGSDVKAAYDKFIQNKPAVVLSVVPQGKSDWQATTLELHSAKRELPDYSKHDRGAGPSGR